MPDELQNHINKEVQDALKSHAEHLQIANHEMGVIKEHIGIIRADISFIKEKSDKQDTRFWWLLGTIITTLLGILTAIFFKK